DHAANVAVADGKAYYAGPGGGPAPEPPPSDTLPPTTTAALPPLPASGWYTTPVTLTLTAADAGSGVAATFYRLNAGAWLTYTAPVPITAEGSTAVSFHSIDHAGNAEPIRQLTVRIDTQPPHTTHLAAPASVVSGTAIAVTWAVTDTASGVLTTTLWVQVPGGGWHTAAAANATSGLFNYVPNLGTGTYCFALQSTDLAANAQPAPAAPGAVCTDVTAGPVDPTYWVYLPFVIRP
ncbi:MAG: hypothetical protein KC425_08815, partial [Anaerolineales bacterium]|nr:hypothetical protein [Anaerolineales bacterium]